MNPTNEEINRRNNNRWKNKNKNKEGWTNMFKDFALLNEDLIKKK